MSTSFFRSDASDRRINEHVADAEEDRALLMSLWLHMRAELDKLHRRDVTLCDGGNGTDLIALARQFRPHSPEQVAIKALEVAIELESIG